MIMVRNSVFEKISEHFFNLNPHLFHQNNVNNIYIFLIKTSNLNFYKKTKPKLGKENSQIFPVPFSNPNKNTSAELSQSKNIFSGSHHFHKTSKKKKKKHHL